MAQFLVYDLNLKNKTDLEIMSTMIEIPPFSNSEPDYCPLNYSLIPISLVKKGIVPDLNISSMPKTNFTVPFAVMPTKITTSLPLSYLYHQIFEFQIQAVNPANVTKTTPVLQVELMALCNSKLVEVGNQEVSLVDYVWKHENRKVMQETSLLKNFITENNLKNKDPSFCPLVAPFIVVNFTEKLASTRGDYYVIN